ncbi:MAG: amidohydrolase [Clostridiales bacterium]|nr:amidohydrolase [Clostridiales bacterium]
MREEHYQMAVTLRHELHMHPEASMQESWTKQHLMDFLKEHTDLEVVDRGKWFYAVYHAGEDRPSIAFRADMDAVPVEEPEGLVPYASCCPGVSHKCGHDGHSASLAAFALELEGLRPQKNVFLIFQHAEETGQGAKECAALLEEASISEIYAFHNLPGVTQGSLVVLDGVTQYASTGMILRFTGKKSHASYPENGINPAFAISEIVSSLEGITRTDADKGLLMITVIQVLVGERAFGTSPGYGELLLTIRGGFEQEMNGLIGRIENLARERAAHYGLQCSFAYEDTFPETRNRPEAVARVRQAAKDCGIPLEDLKEPWRASEDFGYYTKQIPGAMFYLGSGDAAPLHTALFDFPDPLIRSAVAVFSRLCELD